MDDWKYLPIIVEGSGQVTTPGQSQRLMIDFAGVPDSKASQLLENIAKQNTMADIMIVNVKHVNDSQLPLEGGGARPRYVGMSLQRKSKGANAWKILPQTDWKPLADKNIQEFLGRLFSRYSQAREHGHFVSGDNHSESKYAVGPLMEKPGVSDLVLHYMADKLEKVEIEHIVPWAETGKQMGMSLAYLYAERFSRPVPTLSLTGKTVTPTGETEPVLDDTEKPKIAGKRCLLLIDVLFAGQTIKPLYRQVQRFGGYVVAVASVVRFLNSPRLMETLDEIKTKMVTQPNGETGNQAHNPYERVHWLFTSYEPVFQAGDCPLCEANKGPPQPMWPVDSYDKIDQQAEAGSSMRRDAPITWDTFWINAENAKAIGNLEEQVADSPGMCTHDHDGQIVDLARLCQTGNGIWETIQEWAKRQVEPHLPSQTDRTAQIPIQMVTSNSSAAQALATRLKDLLGSNLVS